MSTKSNVLIKNKKASFDYEFIDRYTAGIILTGTEVKSLRAGKANLVDSFCYVHNSELWVKGMHISEYSFGSYANHEPKRDRKLLLKRREIHKLEEALKDRGTTIVAYKMYMNEKGWAKVEIALARGKKQYDKREDLKEKDAKREISRVMKHF